MADEKTRANGNNIILRERRRGQRERKREKYDINEESKALELSNNEVHDEFTQSRFRGVAYRREIPDNSSRRGGHGRGLHASLSNFFFDSFLSVDNRFVGGHYRVAARPRSLRGVEVGG